MDESSQLLDFSDEELRQHAVRIYRRLDECHYRLGLALLAIEKRGLHRLAECSSVVQYAVLHLGMDGHKASEVLRAARSLVNLPSLSAAFERGEVGWGKIREITRVATPDTDQYWRELAAIESTEEIQRRVSLSPRAHKRAVVAENQPAHAEEPLDFISEPCSASSSPPRSPAPEAPGPPVPEPPARLVKMVYYLTPDQYARLERGEDYVRQQAGRRLKREDVLMGLVDRALSSATKDAVARLPLILKVEAATGTGWYDTRQGLLPATREQIERVLRMAGQVFVSSCNPRAAALKVLWVSDEDPFPAPLILACRDLRVRSRGRRKGGRKRIGRKLYRALMARAGGRCEMSGCGRGMPLHAHHVIPLSEGGTNCLENLKLYCSACHGLTHERDFKKSRIGTMLGRDDRRALR